MSDEGRTMRAKVPENTFGSKSEAFQLATARDVLNGVTVPLEMECDQRAAQQIEAMIGMKPGNELEALVAGQILLANSAAAECFRRAALQNQTFEGREMNLRLGAKAQGSMAKLIDSLQKLRGESGKQSVHVHHHHHQTDNRTQVAATFKLSGPGEGQTENGRQPYEPETLAHEPGLALEPDTPLRSEEPARKALPSSRDEGEEALSTAWREKPRRAEG